MPRLRLALLPVLALVGLVAAGCGNRADPYRHFHSRPDLRPLKVTISVPAHDTAPGYVFLAPKQAVDQAGPLIVDNTGEPIWFRALDTHAVADFRVQSYRGKPVLTWWRGKAEQGVGTGWDEIMDSSYQEVTRVHAGNGLVADIHEFTITPKGTALITVYHRLDRDLSSIGGPANGSILEGVVQEIDIATGKVVFEWHSSEHVDPSESYSDPPPANKKATAPFDYFHINSIDLQPDGNFLVSARNTHTIYEIDRRTGKILWRIGGKKSDFTLGPGVEFAWQHNARWHPNGTISLFDNEAAPEVRSQSRAMILKVDTTNMRVTVDRLYTHPGLLAGSQGDTQLLPNGNVFVGWGARPNFTEFSPGGTILFDGSFKPDADSYRIFRFPWHGMPDTKPALKLESDRRGRVTAYMSWNGATTVASWQVLAGPDADHLSRIVTVPRTGFETAVPLGWLHQRYVEVKAQSLDGTVLATSQAKPKPPR